MTLSGGRPSTLLVVHVSWMKSSLGGFTGGMLHDGCLMELESKGHLRTRIETSIFRPDYACGLSALSYSLPLRPEALTHRRTLTRADAPA
jgi:hypothetical protein